MPVESWNEMHLTALRFWDIATNTKFTHQSLQAAHVARSAPQLKIKATILTILNYMERWGDRKENELSVILQILSETNDFLKS